MIHRLLFLLIPISALAVEPDRGAYFYEPCASIVSREQANGIGELLVEPSHDLSTGGKLVASKAHDGTSQHSFLYACDGEKWSLSHTATFTSMSEATKYLSTSISYFNAKHGKPLERNNHLLSFWNKAYLQFTNQPQASQIYLWEVAPNDIELVLSSAPRHGWEVWVHMSQTSPRDKAILYPTRANNSFKADAVPARP